MEVDWSVFMKDQDQHMEERYFVIVSFDALSNRDLETLKQLPGFKRLMRDASYCTNVHSVYPSNTYPCHSSISTGMYPMNHGVVSNTLLQINQKVPDWNWTRNRIRVDTFYDAAMRKGYTTCALLWPVTGKSKITYNLPEIFPNRFWKNQVMVSLANGTPDYLIDINSRFKHLRNGRNQPELDLFVEAAAHYTMKTKRPNIMMIHFVELDAMRHKHGYDSDEAKKALLSYDQKLTGIYHMLDEEGITDKTTLFVLGDHDQIPVHTAVHLNSVFKDKGLIRTKKQKITDYDVYAHGQDGSCYIYMKNPEDEEMKAKVLGILETLKNREDFGIEEIFSREETMAFGANRKAAFMLEAKRGFFFTDDHTRPALMKLDKDAEGEDQHGKSTHGYHPDKENYQTVFFATGKGIRKNVEIQDMSLIDEGPTFARVMGVKLHDTDGRILQEILED